MPKKVGESKSKINKKGKGKKKEKASIAEEVEVTIIREDADATPSTALNETEEDKTHVGGVDDDVVSVISQKSEIKPEPPTADNTTEEEFIQECLEAHNNLRAKHGALPLTLNDELARISQEWANKLAKNKKLQRYTGFGENVYWNPDKPTGNSPAEAWYSEIDRYDFTNLEGQKGTAHFTQLIWKSTEMIGIAMQSGKNGYFVVVNYFPPGNMVGRFPDNVHVQEPHVEFREPAMTEEN